MSEALAVIVGCFGLLWWTTKNSLETDPETKFLFHKFFQLSSVWTSVFLIAVVQELSENTASLSGSVPIISTFYNWSMWLGIIYSTLWFLGFILEVLMYLKKSKEEVKIGNPLR